MSEMPIAGPLYHGTVSIINEIDLKKGRGYKDFGKGFYLAVRRKQAEGMRDRNVKANEMRYPGKKISGYLYKFSLNKEVLSSANYYYEDTLKSKSKDELNILYFSSPSVAWVDFVLKCRKSVNTPHKYDVVIGPTADDAMTECLNKYLSGAYGSVKSDSAKKQLIDNLMAEKYGMQVFIATNKGLKILRDKVLL